MDLSKLSNHDKITAAGGIVLVIASFLPWYSVVGFGISGWSSGALAIIGILTGIGAAGLATYDALTDDDLTIGSFTASQVSLMAAVAGVGFIVLRLLTTLSFVAFGLLLAIAATIAIAIGTYRSVTAAGLDVPLIGAISKGGEDPDA